LQDFEEVPWRVIGHFSRIIRKGGLRCLSNAKTPDFKSPRKSGAGDGALASAAPEFRGPLARDGFVFLQWWRLFGVFGGGALAGEASMELGQGPTPNMHPLGRPLEPPAGTVAADECFVRIWCLGSRTVRAGRHCLRCPSVAVCALDSKDTHHQRNDH
jgi:hypothetical protein